MTVPRPLAAAAAALALALSVAGCGDDGEPEAAEGTETARIVLDWFPNADHAGVYAAVASGAFTEAGVDPDLIVPSDPAAALKQVAAGEAEFAISYEPEVLLARSQGLPVVAVAAVVPRPLNAVIARADRDIARPRDLEGKTVGATGLPSDAALLRTVVRADGGDPDRVRIQSLGFTLAPALAAGRVDALIGAYWNIEVPEIEDKGVDVEVFRLDDFGVPRYDELVLVTSDATAAERPALVEDVIRALRAGHEAVVADPGSGVEPLMTANPDLDRELLTAQVAGTAPLFVPEAGAPLGIDPGAWEDYADWMTAEGLLERPVDPAEAVTDRFQPEDR